MRWMGRISYLFLNGILFVNMQVAKRLKRILGQMWKNGIGIIQRFPSMPRSRSLFAYHIHAFVVAQVANGIVGEKAQKVV